MSLAEILPLTGIPRESMPADVLVCGDPERADAIASHLDHSQLLSHCREYRTITGSFQGMPVAVSSHGIGAPGAAIAFEEIIAAGGMRLIRCGTCGSMQPGIRSGHLVVATAAVANTGYARETVPEGYPAIADVELTLSLAREAERAQREFSTGIVLTRDNFYAGVDPPNAPNYLMMSKANVVAVEMECAALFIIGSLRKVRTAAILAVDGNVLDSGEMMDTYQPRQDSVRDAVEAEIDIALRALFNLHNR